MKLELKMNLTNSAFRLHNDIDDILSWSEIDADVVEVGDVIDAIIDSMPRDRSCVTPGDSGLIRDSNGNTVGNWEVTEETCGVLA